jgi:hypothetical protein
MKQKLLLTILPLLLFAATLQAQNHVWDFGNDNDPSTGTWPADAVGVADNVVRDNLGIFMGTTSTSNIGIIDTSGGSSSNWLTAGDVDGYSSAYRFKFNGDSGITDIDATHKQPTKRYVYFTVTGACTVKIWVKATSGRSLYFADESYDITGGGPLTVPASGYMISEYNYTGGPGKIYLMNDAATYLVKMEVSPASALGTTTTLGAADFNAAITTNLKAVGNKIYLSDVKSNTEVNIYSITGALVKSFKTNEDTNFSFKSGLWIATVKTAEGQKSFKLLTH